MYRYTPRRRTTQPKTEVLFIRLTEEEKALLARVCEMQGISMSEYVADLMLDRALLDAENEVK